MTETLADLLADNFIRLKRMAPGANEHIRCPKCEGGRTGEVSFSVTIDPDGQGYTAFCHRGSCGFTEGKRLNSSKAPERAQRPRKVFQPAKGGYVADWFWNWFEQRGITGGTVEAFSCYATDHFFPDMGAKHQAVVIPFTWRGEITNRKYRAEPGKKGMAQEKDATPTLFNIDRALETGNGTLIWVEGELDVMALYECGIPNAVSLKDGAGKIGEKSDKRYEALTTHQEELVGVKRFILAGDMDEPGRAQVEELARRLGKQRCSTVEWPEGCKDANDTLMRGGPQAVQDALDAAEPYPIEGLYRITAKALQNLADAPPPPTMTTGCGATDAILRLPTEGRLIVITGFPNHGKSNWLRWVMLHTARHHDRRWVVFSPEHQPWEHYAAECVEVLTGLPFWSPTLTKSERASAATWLRDHVVMMGCDALEEAPTLKWIMGKAEVAIVQYGVTDLMIDPWNEVDPTRPGNMSETEFIGLCLQKLKAFALRHGVNVWVVAHPSKPIQMTLKRGERIKPPGPYDIHGSAHWANRPDLGMTVHSPSYGKAEVHLWKIKFKQHGRRGEMATLDFDRNTGRYSSGAAEIPNEMDDGF